MTIWMARQAAEEILAETLASAPAECCGLLLGEGDCVTDICAAANVAADPLRRFEIDPAVLIAAEREARLGGRALAGYYHSHPNGLVQPSATDLATAPPDGRLWIIIANGALAAFRAPDRPGGTFRPIALEIGAPGLASREATGHVRRKPVSGAMMPEATRNSADDQVDLAALLCSRLCHDLLSPVGAMNNGLELLADETDPAMRERCIDLLGESAASAANKLKFFRLAFGAAGGFGPSVDTADAKAVAAALVEDGRTKLAWELPDGPLPKTAVKILLNMVLIAREALVRGGTLFVGAESREGETEIVVQAEGPRLVLDEQVRKALAGDLDPAEIDSRTAAAYMVRSLAKKGGGTVQIAGGKDEPLLMGALIRSA